jgi:protein arginine N-methyltransferase 3
MLIVLVDLDFFGAIKLVNYIRSSVRAGNKQPSLELADFRDDKYMQPVLEDDAFLFSMDDILSLAQKETTTSVDSTPSSSQSADSDRITALEEELSRLRIQFAEYQNTVSSTLDAHWSSREPANASNAPNTSSKEAQGSRAPLSSAADPPSLNHPASTPRDDDTHYFDSYSYNDIHETMLKDSIRTNAYRDFIYAHKPLFKDSTVLDIGCGTGILSMFATKAGAKTVFAVDNSSIIAKAKENIATNGMSNTIKLVRGKVEEAELPWPSEPTLRQLKPEASEDKGKAVAFSQGSSATNEKKVDIILSEWMGYALLYESMLDSVISARNRLLNPATGIMVPSHCTLHIAPLSVPDFVADTIGFWDDVYGFDMHPMTEKIVDEVVVRSFSTEDVVSEESARFRTLDLRTVEVRELEWEGPAGTFEVTVAKDVEEGIDAWGIWFDTFFLPTRGMQLPEEARAESWPTDDDAKGNAFTTGPGGKETHWRAGMCVIDPKKRRSKKRTAGLKKGEIVRGEVAYRKAKDNSRALEIEIEWAVVGREEESRCKQLWFLR